MTSCLILDLVFFGTVLQRRVGSQGILIHWVAHLLVLSVPAGLVMLCLWISFEMSQTYAKISLALWKRVLQCGQFRSETKSLKHKKSRCSVGLDSRNKVSRK